MMNTDSSEQVRLSRQRANGGAIMPAAGVRCERERLPDVRTGWTHKGVIHGESEVCPHCGKDIRDRRVKFFLTVNHYADGRPAEMFLTMDESGSTLDGFADAFATAVSLLWQRGMSLEETVRKFGFVGFQPAGMTEDEDVRSARSVVDYAVRKVAAGGRPQTGDRRLENADGRPETADGRPKTGE